MPTLDFSQVLLPRQAAELTGLAEAEIWTLCRRREFPMPFVIEGRPRRSISIGRLAGSSKDQATVKRLLDPTAKDPLLIEAGTRALNRRFGVCP